MNEHEDLGRLLRQAFPAHSAPPAPSRDLWQEVLRGGRQPMRRPWVDLGLAALVAVTLWMAPGWLWLLIYHL